MKKNTLEDDVNCEKCWYLLNYIDEDKWTETDCPKCGRSKADLVKLQDRYFNEEC